MQMLYGTTVPNNKLMNKKKKQIEAGRIVSGTTKLVAIDKLYRELGWLKLSERRKLHKLFLFYKMQNGLAPDYLVDLVPPRVGNETPYSLRNADNYQQVHANSRLYFDSFLPSTIREWNNLPADVKSAQTLTSFKYKFERIPRKFLNITSLATEVIRYFIQD